MFLEGNGQNTNNERIECLRLILEREQHRSVSYVEALEVGGALIRFFEVLAEGGANG